MVRGGCWVGWWDEGEGTESVLRVHFQLRKIGRIYIKIHLYPYTPPDYLCDFNYRLEVVKENRIFRKTLAGKSR